MPNATRRQLNAIGAFIVTQQIGDPDRAGDLAYEMLDACGFDMSDLDAQTTDRPDDQTH